MAAQRSGKVAVSWIVVAALILALVALYARNRGAELELANLRQQTQVLKAAAESQALNPERVQADELARLRKENEEIHRLRNEVRQLREEKQQQARTVQPAAGATAQGTAQVQQLLAENQRLRAENQQLQAASVLAQQSSIQAQAQVQANACINQLRSIQAAKEQWALENSKPATAFPRPADLQPYLKDNALPACPAGGSYTLNPVGTVAACNIPGHAVPGE
jgi:hypothetical protein